MNAKRFILATVAAFFCGMSGVSAETTPPVAVPSDPAARDPFCAVTVEAASTSPTSLVAHLRADGASAGAHLVIFSATEAYAVDVPALALSGPQSVKNTSQFAIAFPKSIDPRFIYVDSYRLDGGADTSCPTEARSFGNGFAAALGFGLPPTASALHFNATFVQALPALPCGSALEAAAPRMVVSPDIPPPGPDRLDGSSQILVYVDAAGRPIKAYVFKSTASKAEDDIVKQAALASSYAPAQFYCTPVPGTYLERADFKRESH